MNGPTKKISEGILCTDLSELAHALLRDLATACRKVAIYGPGHPLGKQAIEKPFLILGKIFRFRDSVGFNSRHGDLYVLNILLKDTIYNGHLMQYLQMLDVSALLFKKDLSVQELAKFINGVVQRDTLYDPEYRLAEYLRKAGIFTIEVNSEAAFELFEKRKLYRGNIRDDYSVRRLALDQIGDRFLRLFEIQQADSDRLGELGIDFSPDIISYLLPERLASLSSDKIISELRNRHEDKIDPNQWDRMIALAGKHPQGAEILSQLGEPERSSDDIAATASIELSLNETIVSIDSNAAQKVSGAGNEMSSEEFGDTVIRLLNTGHHDSAANHICDMIDRLGASDSVERLSVLVILTTTVDRLRGSYATDVITRMIDAIDKHLSNQTETYEFSELIRALFERCMHLKLWKTLAEFCTCLSKYREQQENVTIYSSFAVKKGLEQVNRTELIERLIDRLVKARSDEVAWTKTILCAIGSEEVALSLSLIISHPARPVRQHALKVLTNLGQSSLTVFSRMMADDAYFRRDDDKYELPDTRWYVVRNTIFVLGSLGVDRGIDALRLRMNDRDVRVRREIVRALEKIGSDAAVDMLALMAEDPAAEIRQAAIIGIGLLGSEETAHVVIDLARRFPTEATRAVMALGKLGGKVARDYLCTLMDDHEEFMQLLAGKVPKEEIRVAVVKALGAIGDSSAVTRVEKFSNNMSKTQKIFLKGSLLNKAISDVLSRK